MTLQYVPLKTFGLITCHIEAKINKRKKIFSTLLTKEDLAGLASVLITSGSQRPPLPEPVRSRADPMDPCVGLS